MLRSCGADNAVYRPRRSRVTFLFYLLGPILSHARCMRRGAFVAPHRSLMCRCALSCAGVIEYRCSMLPGGKEGSSTDRYGATVNISTRARGLRTTFESLSTRSLVNVEISRESIFHASQSSREKKEYRRRRSRASLSAISRNAHGRN